MSSFAGSSSGGFSMLGGPGALAGVPASIQSLLQTGTLQSNLFPPNSRYAGIETAMMETDNRQIIFLRRRFVPQPERFALLYEYKVTDGKRLDTIAAHCLSDPEQFWRICDANRAIRPEELTEESGRLLRITLPEGIAGATTG